MLMLGLLLSGLHPGAAVAQTDAIPQASVQRLRRRPPTPYVLHGSISGSQANPFADHALARLFDHLSERNPLGFEFFGYLDQGVTLNPSSPSDRTNGPVLNNYRSNAYQMSGVYLVAERKVDPDCCCVQLGGRIDTLYGTDAAYGLSNGLDAKIVSDEASRFYKLAFPQIYANLFLPIGPGVSFKVGHFYSPVSNSRTGTASDDFETYSHALLGRFAMDGDAASVIDSANANLVALRRVLAATRREVRWGYFYDSNDRHAARADL